MPEFADQPITEPTLPTEQDRVKRVWKVKLRLTKEQEKALQAQSEIQRRLYNRALAQRRDAYQKDGQSLGLYEQKRDLITGARHDPARMDHEDMINTAVGCSQQTLMRLDRAFRAFFRRAKAGEAPGFPKFRRYGEFNTLIFNSFAQGIRFDRVTERLTIMYVPGTVRLLRTKRHRKHYPLPEDALLKMPWLTHRPEGWYFNVVLDLPAPTITQDPEIVTHAVGILVGFDPIIYTSDGEALSAPNYLRCNADQIAKAQQVVSRRKHQLRTDENGEPILDDQGRRRYIASKGRRKAVLLLARRHRKVKNARELWQRTIAKSFAIRYGIIIREDLHPSAHISKPIPRPDPNDPTHYLPNAANVAAEVNKAILDNAWSQLFRFLQEAVEKRGGRVIAIPQFEPTQRCSRCRAISPDLAGIGDGLYRCTACGLVIPASVNNAANILQDGLKRTG